MILAEFAKFLQQNNEGLLTKQTTPLKLLPVWLGSVMEKNPKTNADKIIHKEIMFAKNQNGDYIIVGKSDSGRVLVSALIKFAKSYDNYTHSKWIEIAEKAFYNKENF